MAWAEQLPSGRWRAMIRVDHKQRNATPGKTYTSKAEAERQAGAKELDQRQPGALPLDAGKLTWGTWEAQWWPRRRVADSTRARDVSRREHHLRPRWDSVPLEEITREDVETWVVELFARPDLSPSTVQRIYHLFSASMRAAVLAKKIPASPCLSIPLERAPLPDEVYLTKDEVERIVFHLTRPHKLLVYLGAYCGLRWGELAALHRQRVDLTAGRVDIVLAWDIKNRTYKTPKDHEKRSVPLPEWLGEELDEWFTALGPAARCGVTHPPKLGSRCASGLVVPGLQGVPTDYDSYRRNKWAPVVGKWVWISPDAEFDAKGRRRTWPSDVEARKVLGADARVEREWAEGTSEIEGPVTIHSLRHSYASWLLQEGRTLEEVSKLMGHASLLTTQRYAHLRQTHWEGVRGALARPVPRAPAPLQECDELAQRREDRFAGS